MAAEEKVNTSWRHRGRASGSDASVRGRTMESFRREKAEV